MRHFGVMEAAVSCSRSFVAFAVQLATQLHDQPISICSLTHHLRRKSTAHHLYAVPRHRMRLKDSPDLVCAPHCQRHNATATASNPPFFAYTSRFRLSSYGVADTAKLHPRTPFLETPFLLSENCLSPTLAPLGRSRPVSGPCLTFLRWPQFTSNFSGSTSLRQTLNFYRAQLSFCSSTAFPQSRGHGNIDEQVLRKERDASDGGRNSEHPDSCSGHAYSMAQENKGRLQKEEVQSLSTRLPFSYATVAALAKHIAVYLNGVRDSRLLFSGASSGLHRRWSPPSDSPTRSTTSSGSSAANSTAATCSPPCKESEDASQYETVMNALWYALDCEAADDGSCLEKQAELLNGELQSLQQLKAQLDQQAARYSSFCVWGGVAFFAAQWAVLFYGTYYVFSWDIIEPLTYFIGTLNAIAAYSFSAIAKREYSACTLRNALQSRRRQTLYRKHNLDIGHYHWLIQETQNLQRQQKARSEIARYFCGKDCPT